MAEQMDDRYRQTLIQMMQSQAYRELAAAQMFGFGLQFVPELKWIKFMSWHIQEEVEHYQDVAKMYQSFTGESVEPWCNDRLKNKPIDFATSWYELAMAQFLYDRGGFWQLQEYDNCSYEPYQKTIEKIIKEEAGHQELGEKIVIELTATGEFENVKQEIFNKWFKQGMLSFGRPNTEGNQYAMSVGLKKRDSGEVMQDFVNDVKNSVRECKLQFPEPAAIGLEVPDNLDWSL